jgi:hypothetical protein
MAKKASRGNKSTTSKAKSAERAKPKERKDKTSPHNDGIKSSRRPTTR